MSGRRRSSTTTSKGSAAFVTVRSADAASEACSTSRPSGRERFGDRPANERLVVDHENVPRELFRACGNFPLRSGTQSRPSGRKSSMTMQETCFMPRSTSRTAPLRIIAMSSMRH